MGKRPQPRLQIDALTGDWRHQEAGVGRGPEPCEPGGRSIMEGPPLGPGWQDITWPDQMAPRGRKASSTRKIKLNPQNFRLPVASLSPPCCPTW